jgi:hypothetical protein
MTSPRTLGDEAATYTLDLWHVLARRVRSLPVEYRQEVLRTVSDDVADLRDDVAELRGRGRR